MFAVHFLQVKYHQRLTIWLTGPLRLTGEVKCEQHIQ